MVKYKLYKHKIILFIYSFVLVCFTSNFVKAQTHIGTTSNIGQSFGDNWPFTPTTGPSPCWVGTYRIMQFTFTAGASSICIYNGSGDYISVNTNAGSFIQCISSGNEIVRNLTIGNTYRLYFYGNNSVSGGSTLAWIRNSAGTYNFAKVDSLKLLDIEKKYSFFTNYRPDTVTNSYYYYSSETSNGDTITKNEYAVVRSKATAKIYRHYYTKEIELNNFAWSSSGTPILQGLPDGVSLGSAYNSFYLSQQNKATYDLYSNVYNDVNFATNWLIEPILVDISPLLLDTLASGILTKSTDEIFGLTHPLKPTIEEINFSNSNYSFASRISKGANELIFSYNNVANEDNFVFDNSAQNFPLNQVISSYTALGNPNSTDSTRYIKNVVTLPAPHSFYSINVRNNKCLNEPNSLIKIKFKYPKNVTNIILEKSQALYYPAPFTAPNLEESQFNSNPAFIKNINLLSPTYANISNIVLHQDSVSFELLNLPKGVYRITAISTYTMNSLKKEEVEFYFRVENDPFITIANVQKTNLTCPNVNNGVAEVLINGGWGIYDVELVNSDGSQTIKTFKDSVLHNYRWAVFDSLAGGGFNLFVKNDPIAGCSDETTDITQQLTAPLPFVFNKINTNYSCFNTPSAQINISLAQGGSTPYTFNLQSSLNSTTWTNTIATTTLTTYNITDEAYYRLIAVDANLCTYTSDTTLFDRPDTLKINSVTVSDIKCLGEQGKLLLNRFGGTPPYEQRFSTNNWSTQTPFGDTTLLNANSYAVKLIDANLCEVTNPNTYTITEPTELLTISLSKKDYNGRDLSCFGSTDGEVTLSAGGGNGAFYPSMYEYNQNAGVFVSSPVFSGLGFGTYTYSVRDNRGCIVSTYTILQTTPVLTASTTAKQNVVCYSGNDGEITTLANGGTAPYRFVIGTSNTKYDNSTITFNNLARGLYTLQVTDTNNCQIIYTDSIIALNPDMSTTLLQQKDVTCFGGTNGFAKIQTNGGVTPYTYVWNNATNADSLTNVAAGNYSIIVTDQQACSTIFNVTINQPTALQVTPNAYLGCNSNNSGIVSINAIGGIPPYLFKLDVDTIYKTNSVYKQLKTGSYIATVKDSNNCVSSAIATINETLSAPQPVFMVSTFSQQSDTLVLIDISEPKPDSLVWVFADSIIYRAGTMFAPQVVFADTGSHLVTMRAFYDDCEIAVTKTVKVNKTDSLATENGLIGIKSLVVSPNPNDGNFTITTELHVAQNFAIFVYNQAGVEFYRAPFANSNYQSVSVNMPNDLPSGEYVVWVLSEFDAKHFNIIINK